MIIGTTKLKSQERPWDRVNERLEDSIDGRAPAVLEGVVRASLHGVLLDLAAPELGSFSDAMSDYRNSAPEELNQLISPIVSQNLSSSARVLTSKILPVPRSPIATVNSEEELVAFLARQSRTCAGDPLLALPVQIPIECVSSASLDNYLRTFPSAIRENYTVPGGKHHPWNRWGWERRRRFTSLAASKLIHSMQDRVKSVPLWALEHATRAVIDEFQRKHIERYQDIARRLAECHGVIFRSKPLYSPYSSYKRTEADKETLEKLSQTAELTRAEKILRRERHASDSIRREIIPELLNNKASLQDAFWKIHSSRFGEAPYLSHSFGDYDSVSEYVASRASEGFYRDNLGNIRTVDISSETGTNHVRACYLMELEHDFFEALTQGLQLLEPNNKRQFFDLMLKADFFLECAHFPFDGSGRNTEDFLVYFAKRAGYDLSFSETGYRIILGGTLEQRENIKKNLRVSLDRRLMKNFGLETGPHSPKQWHEHLMKALSHFHPNPHGVLESERYLEANRIVQAIRDNDSGTQGLMKTYPELKKLRTVLRQSLRNSYHTGNEQSSQWLDKAVAEAMTGTCQDPLTLFRKQANAFPEDPFVRKVAAQFIHLGKRRLRQHYVKKTLAGLGLDFLAADAA